MTFNLPDVLNSSSVLVMNTWIDKAFEHAKATLKNSHSPYSKFAVASVVKFKGSEHLYSGCNVENASYGLCMCAERVAIFKGVSELGKSQLEGVLVLTKTSPPAPPCGACLQVIREFGNESTPIVICNLDGEREPYRLKDFLPISFGPEML